MRGGAAGPRLRGWAAGPRQRGWPVRNPLTVAGLAILIAALAFCFAGPLLYHADVARVDESDKVHRTVAEISKPSQTIIAAPNAA